MRIQTRYIPHEKHSRVYRMPNSLNLMYQLSTMAFCVKQSKLTEIATRYDNPRSLWKQTVTAILSNVFENILVNCFCLWMQYQQLRQLTDVVLHNAKEKKHSPENLAQSAMLLNKNPEVYTIWNYRREALANVLEVSQSYTSPGQYWSKSTLYLHIGCLHWIFKYCMLPLSGKISLYEPNEEFTGTCGIGLGSYTPIVLYTRRYILICSSSHFRGSSQKLVSVKHDTTTSYACTWSVPFVSDTLGQHPSKSSCFVFLNFQDSQQRNLTAEAIK